MRVKLTDIYNSTLTTAHGFLIIKKWESWLEIAKFGKSKMDRFGFGFD
jgi:hypothetical protein